MYTDTLLFINFHAENCICIASTIEKKIFCCMHTGSQRCVQIGYKVVREVLSVVRVTDLGRTLAAHVVIYKTAKTKPFKVILECHQEYILLMPCI